MTTYRRSTFGSGICLAALLIVIAGTVSSSQAGSIWAKRCATARSPYTDDVAHQIGDLLTIKISEDSKIDNKAKRDLKKDTDRSSDFDGSLGIGMPGDLMWPYMPGFTMSAKSGQALNGKADYKDERKYTDSITVVVMDVLPNRNLVVHGTRDRDIAGDIQALEVTGIVRPSDIAFDNTIRSNQVANFRIVTQHKGDGATYNRPGWLGRIMDFVWPF